MLRSAIFSVVLVVVASPASAQIGSPEILIFGGYNRDEFLGCYSCGDYDSDSVWNRYSTHGWSNRYGTWSRYGPHKSRYSSTSACSPYASSPPVLVDRRGNYYGELSVSRTRADSVCGANGARRVCTALLVMCGDG